MRYVFISSLVSTAIITTGLIEAGEIKKSYLSNPILYKYGKSDEQLLEHLYYFGIVSSYNPNYFKLNIDKLFFLGNQVKLLMCEGLFISLEKVEEHEGEFFLQTSDLFSMCHAIKTRTDDVILNQKKYFLCIKSIKESSEYSESSKKHYDAAISHGIDFLGHSVAAGLAIEYPPLALYETYNAVKSLNSMADEYLKGKEIELSDEAAQNFNDMTGKE